MHVKKRNRLWILPIIVPILLLLVILFILYHRVGTYKLIMSINAGNVEAVEELLSGGVDPNRTNYPPSKLWYLWEMSAERPLAVACRKGNYEIVKLLVEYGATAEYVENTGWTPLRETLVYYHSQDLEIVKLLLENGADPYCEEYERMVFIAAQMAPKVFDAAKTNGTVFSTGYDEETAKGITEIVKLLLTDDSVNITTFSDKTLLMFAVQKGNLYLANYLLAQGCDKEMTDSSGKTALDYAVEVENQELIELLS